MTVKKKTFDTITAYEVDSETAIKKSSTNTCFVISCALTPYPSQMFGKILNSPLDVSKKTRHAKRQMKTMQPK